MVSAKLVHIPHFDTLGVMELHMARFAVIVALALFTAACQTTATTSVDAGTTIHADPSGDAGAAPTYDIIEIRTVRTSTTLEFRVWTSPAPVLPAPGALASATDFTFIGGFNTDLNAATGLSMGGACGSGQGLEFLVDGAFQSPRNVDGTYRVEVAAGGTTGVATGNAAVALDGPRLTLTIPLAALGGDDGRTNATILAGAAALADCAPDAGQMHPTRLGEPTAFK